jgi:acetyl/propionyl-CoA carboxylase alpha subunit
MHEITVLVDGLRHTIGVDRHGNAFITAEETGERRFVMTPLEPGVFLLSGDGRSSLIHVARAGRGLALHMDGCTLEYEIEPEDGAPTIPPRGGPVNVTIPMPGIVTQVLIRAGDRVAAGQALVIVEAMKVEHVIRATGEGIVLDVRVRPGDQVEGGAAGAQIGPVLP